MTTPQKRLLEILSGCPDGATKQNLDRLKIHQRVIDELVRSRLVTVSERIRITQAGKYAMLTMGTGQGQQGRKRGSYERRS
jgi:hypothetical protein